MQTVLDQTDHRRRSLERRLDSSRLDRLETSPPLRLPLTYADHARQPVLSEWEATDSALSAIYVDSNPARLVRFRECRKYAFFFRGVVTGTVELHSNACHNRWCPICARARAAQVKDSVTAWTAARSDLKMITLTLRSSDIPLGEQVDHLHESFRRLRKNVYWQSLVRGGIWFLQTTYNSKTKQWHPHIHILADADYMPKRLLSTLWERSSNGSFIVDIKRIFETAEATNYVSRYVSRPHELSTLDRDKRVELITELHSRRLCGTFGTGRECRIGHHIEQPIEETTYIGSWRAVVKLANVDPHAYAILLCWSSGFALPQGVTCLDEYKHRQPVPLSSAFYEPPPI